MHQTIKHTTGYAYSAPVDYALQKVRLTPLSSSIQTITGWTLDITGGKIETSYLDHYGNHVDLVSITPGAQSLNICASGTSIPLDSNGILGRTRAGVPLWHFQQPTALTTAGAAIKALPKLDTRADAVVESLHALSSNIASALPYKTGTTTVQTPAEEALQGNGGVCQDHAQIFIAAARLARLPARYVSGYLLMDDRIDQDATHAWAEVYVEALGWTGFDVSNGMSPDARYTRIAVGRDARDAAPIEGLRVGSADETLKVSLQIQQ
jgi:transglutaminase-like putative cysteine protease